MADGNLRHDAVVESALPSPLLRSGVNRTDSVPAALHVGVRSLAVVLFLSMLPVTMLVPVLKEIVETRFEASHFWTHSFMWINMLGAVLAAPWLGSISDRLWDRRKVLASALLLDGLLIGGLSMAGSLPWLLVLRFLEGGAHIVALTTGMALGADWAGTHLRGRTMGLLGASIMLGTTVGAPLGGLIGNQHPLLALQAGAIFAFAASVLVLLVLRPFASVPQASAWTETVKLIRLRTDFVYPYVYAFLDRLCVGVIVSSFVLFLDDHHGLTPAQRGGLLSLFMFPFALLCYPVGRLTDRIGRAPCLCLGHLGFGLVFAFYAFASLSALVALMVLSGVLSAIMFAPNLAICADLAPKDRRAAAYAGFNLAGSLGFLTGPLLGGILCGPVAGFFELSNPYVWLFPSIGVLEILWAITTIPWVLRYRKHIP